mmetsp:Transcript_29156/g.71995  ORF Transcript_29156/g.71995 Transcript_29156/m.71995 type:complete len:107 (-) Transcript_29156:99-419(-)
MGCARMGLLAARRALVGRELAPLRASSYLPPSAGGGAAGNGTLLIARPACWPHEPAPGTAEPPPPPGGMGVASFSVMASGAIFLNTAPDPYFGSLMAGRSRRIGFV